jgi:hypothetical protein
MAISFKDIPNKIKDWFDSEGSISVIAGLNKVIKPSENPRAIADLLYALEVKEVSPQEIKPRLEKLGLTGEQLSLALAEIQKMLSPIRQDLLDYEINIDLIISGEETVRTTLTQVPPASDQTKIAPASSVASAPTPTEPIGYAPLRPSFPSPTPDHSAEEANPRIVNYSTGRTQVPSTSQRTDDLKERTTSEVHPANIIDLKDLPQ